MNTRSIGSLSVSIVGLGCNNFGWRIDEAAAREVVAAALDAGVDFFDTADIYGEGDSERILGRALGGRRDDVVLATKFGYDRDEGGGAPDYVRSACEASLRRLGTDRIDLYYLHRPDPATPIAETLGALSELVREGKIREIGCSNVSVEQLREAEAVDSEASIVAVQNAYSLLEREPEEGVLQACEASGPAFVPYFPLESGLLTGKYRKGEAVPRGSRLGTSEEGEPSPMGEKLLTDDRLDTVEALISFAEGRGHTILELAFSWLLERPAVASVIAGATRPEQVRANVSAAGWALTDDELAEVDRITASRRA